MTKVNYHLLHKVILCYQIIKIFINILILYYNNINNVDKF